MSPWAGQGRVLTMHNANPAPFLLASAEDGRVCLWHKAKRLAQVLDGARWVFLPWHPKVSNLLLEVKTANCWFGHLSRGKDLVIARVEISNLLDNLVERKRFQWSDCCTLTKADRFSACLFDKKTTAIFQLSQNHC